MDHFGIDQFLSVVLIWESIFVEPDAGATFRTVPQRHFLLFRASGAPKNMPVSKVEFGTTLLISPESSASLKPSNGVALSFFGLGEQTG